MTISVQKRILIIDDEQPIREVCVRTLTPLGHSVETAENAEQAIACFERHPFDLVVTDYRMPGALDGLALGREIRRRFPETQVILMTGYPTLENAVAALNMGVMDYLVKPFDQAELVDYVNQRHGKLGEISQQPLPKILLVDDSRTLLLLFKSLFEKSGYKVLTATDGKTGLSLALEQKPDLVILDGELPGLNGFEVCRQLRLNAEMQRMKILMLTGGAESEENDRAQKAGADGFFSKQAPRSEIVEKAGQLLHLHKQNFPLNTGAFTLRQETHGKSDQ